MSPAIRRATQRDVAERAGVSTATVSHVFSGRRGPGTLPTDATRRRVLQAADEVGYQLNHIARSLRLRRSEVIALMYPTPASPWSDRLIEQLQAASAPLKLTVIALPVTPTSVEESVLRPLREGMVDGAVLLPDCPIDPADLVDIARFGQSLLVFHDDARPDGFDVVEQDRLTACRSGVERLLGAGHRRVAHLAHERELAEPEASVKYRSYRDALREHSIALDPELVAPVADSRQDAYAAVTALLRSDDPPTAIFSATDRAAIDAVWAARALDVRVPEDLAIVGVGNIPEGETMSPRLTTVGLPELDFTSEVERFFARLTAEVPLPGATLRAPWHLIARESG